MIPSGQVIGAPNLQVTVGGGRDVYRPTGAPRRAGITEIDLRGIDALASNQKAREDQRVQDEFIPMAAAAVEGAGNELTEAVGPGATPESADKALRELLRGVNAPASANPRVAGAMQQLAGARIITTDFLQDLQSDLDSGALFYDESGRVKETFDPEAWFKDKWAKYKDAPIFKLPGGARAVASTMPRLGSEVIGAAGQAWGRARDAQAVQDFSASVKPFFAAMVEDDPDENELALFQANLQGMHALGIPNLRQGAVRAVEMAARDVAKIDPEGAEAIIVRAMEHIQIGPERLGDNAEALRILEPLIAKFQRQAREQEDEDKVRRSDVNMEVRSLFYLRAQDGNTAAAEEVAREYIAQNVPEMYQGTAYESLDNALLSYRQNKAQAESYESRDLYEFYRRAAYSGENYEEFQADQFKMTEEQVAKLNEIYSQRHSFRAVFNDPITRDGRSQIEDALSQIPATALVQNPSLPDQILRTWNAELLAFSEGLERQGVRIDSNEGALALNEFVQKQVTRVTELRSGFEQQYATKRDELVQGIISASTGLDVETAQTLYDQGVASGALSLKDQLDLIRPIQEGLEYRRSVLSPEGAEVAIRTRGHMQNVQAVLLESQANANFFQGFGATAAQTVKAALVRGQPQIEQELIAVAEEFLKTKPEGMSFLQVRDRIRQLQDAKIKELDLELVGIDYDAVTAMVTSGEAPSFSTAIAQFRMEAEEAAQKEALIASYPAPAKDILRRSGYPITAEGRPSIPPHYNNSAVQTALSLHTGAVSKKDARKTLARSAGRIEDLSHPELEIDPKTQQAMWAYGAGWAGLLSADHLMDGIIHLGEPAERERLLRDVAAAEKKLEDFQEAFRQRPGQLGGSRWQSALSANLKRAQDRLKGTTIDATAVLPMLSLYDMPLSFSPTGGPPSEADLDAWVEKTSADEIGLFLSSVTGEPDPDVAGWLKAQRAAIRNYQALR